MVDVDIKRASMINSVACYEIGDVKVYRHLLYSTLGDECMFVIIYVCCYTGTCCWAELRAPG
jgi:hypothetical protein